MKTVRVLLADGHAIVRAGLRALLAGQPEFEIVGEAAAGHEAVRLIAERQPDVTLMNVFMPGLNGLDSAARAMKVHPGARILMFSMYSDEEYVFRALRSGATGYVERDVDRAKLEAAVRAVARGDAFLGATMSKTMAAVLARGDGVPRPADLLTPRQREVLQLIAEGHSTRQIARVLQVSPKTVETHRAQLMERLQVRGIPALVRCALGLGLVRPEPRRDE